MTYRKIMKNITKELKEYKSEIDQFASSYQTERKKFEDELEAMRGKFTESYIGEYRKSWKTKVDYVALIETARTKHQQNVNQGIEQIEQWLNDYFRTPAPADFCATITALKATGVALSNLEFSILQGMPNGYFGQRLLNELAVSRTKTEQRAELENGQAKSVEKEIKNPFGNVRLPNIEKAYDGLQNLRNATWLALNGYCGANNELADVIFPLSKTQEIANDKLREAYGTELPKPTRDALTISQMASSKQCFNETYRPYTEFLKILDEINATIPKPLKKTVLTEDDRRLIDAMIDGKYEHTAREAAAKIARADSRLAEILQLDDRYSSVVKAALEVSDNE